MMTEPDWLTQRGGALRLGPDGTTWYIVLNAQPHYRLVPVPVQGKFGCAITQTINGRRIDNKVLAETTEAAVQAGLQSLAKSLGWL